MEEVKGLVWVAISVGVIDCNVGKSQEITKVMSKHLAAQ